MEKKDTQKTPAEEKTSEASGEKTLEQMLREAEEAGYRRGREEAVELALDKWGSSTDLAPDLLATPKKSFWD